MLDFWGVYIILDILVVIQNQQFHDTIVFAGLWLARQPNAGKYAIHGAYWILKRLKFVDRAWWQMHHPLPKQKRNEQVGLEPAMDLTWKSASHRCLKKRRYSPLLSYGGMIYFRKMRIELHISFLFSGFIISGMQLIVGLPTTTISNSRLIFQRQLQYPRPTRSMGLVYLTSIILKFKQM